MRVLVLLALITILRLPVLAQDSSADKEAAYTTTITGRAEKIVAALELKDSLQAKRVVTTLKDQYRNLNKVYTERDEKIRSIKQKGAEKKITDSLIKSLEEEYWTKARQLHDPFIKNLSKELDGKQITAIKDGMTYNVLNVTYKAMLEMIPSLKTEQKTQIMAWLVEARELATDAESSDKKHWWFGKYKGRINNYLAAQGYDLQKERKGWEERLKAEKEQNTTKQ